LAAVQTRLRPPRRPSARNLSRSAPRMSRLDLTLVGILIAAITALYLIYALRVGNFQDDEEQYMSLARYIAGHFPDALWQHGLYPRGTQRLDSIILALPFALMRGPGAYQMAHAIQCLLFASTALPVMLLARRAGLPRPASLLAAALAIVSPWAVVSTSFLAESATYPAFAWVLYTCWLVLERPSLRHQVLAVLALVVAALARTALIATVPMLPLAVLWHEWSWSLRGMTWRARLRELPRRLWARQRLITALSAAGILVLIANHFGALPGSGLATFAGGYGLPHAGSASELFERYRGYLSRIVVGTGILAFAFALAWACGTLAARRDGRRHALALVCVLGVAGVLLSLLQAGPDERYVLYAAAPVGLCAAAWLSDWVRRLVRPTRALGLLACCGVVVYLLASASWPPVQQPYDFFAFPAAAFYQRVALERAATVRLPLHPGAQTLVAIAVALVALAFALTARRRLMRPAAGVLAVGLLGVCVTQTLYALKKYTVFAGAAAGPDGAARSWVDRSLPAGEYAGALALSMGAGPNYVPVWRATEFWNTAVRYDVFFGAPGTLPLPLGTELINLRLERSSGRIVVAARVPRTAQLPEYLLEPEQGGNSIGLRGKVVAVSSYLPLVLVRPARPLQAEWSISGTNEEGFLASNAPAEATVYRDALGASARCARFTLIGPPNYPGHWPYSVTSGGNVVRGSLASAQKAMITIPLARTSRTGANPVVRVRVHGQVTLPNGIVASAQMAFFAAGSCAPATPAAAPAAGPGGA
jgi:hypothetical protein